jgi:hypothetical protein
LEKRFDSRTHILFAVLLLGLLISAGVWIRRRRSREVAEIEHELETAATPAAANSSVRTHSQVNGQ